MMLLLLPSAFAADLSAAFSDAAEEFQVPEPILLALSYEASRWDEDAASQWGGYGLFDLQEPETDGPDIERAATLLDISPDRLIDEPVQNIRGAAALLASAAARAGDGRAPPPDDLLAWWDAVISFSGRHEPNLQQMYAASIFELLSEGVAPSPAGLHIRPQPVDYDSVLAALPPPPSASCDYSGCYQFAAASSANYSNYSRAASDISYIIIHTVQGSYSGCISWFQNSTASVSAHYVVRSSDGQVTQMVREEDVAWHAGNWSYNLASVGIEHEGWVEEPETWYTDAMYAASAALTNDIATRNGIPLSRSYILGHYEVPDSTHTDPGSGWDWDYYMSLVADGGGSASGNLLGVVAAEDIYTGPYLTDATVWIEETGESVTVDSDGYYRFYDLALEAYTVHADAPGYLEGTCAKTITTGDNWCSIALMPGEDVPEDTGAVEEETEEEPEEGEAPPESEAGVASVGGPPGAKASLQSGCAVASSGSVMAGLLALVGLLGRRRW